ncbi:MAG TPA: hypothetical protein VGM54_10495 [Chthoniobacter sp.]|jgi:ribosomal protein L15E
MSLAELKQGIDSLNLKERTELLHHLHLKWRRDDPEWRAELDRRIDEVRGGIYVNKEDLESRYLRRVAEES